MLCLPSRSCRPKKPVCFSKAGATHSARLLSPLIAGLEPLSMRQMPRSVPLLSAPGGQIRRPCWPRRPTFSGDYRRSAEVS